jgi:hypothetical protein
MFLSFKNQKVDLTSLNDIQNLIRHPEEKKLVSLNKLRIIVGITELKKSKTLPHIRLKSVFDFVGWAGLRSEDVKFPSYADEDLEFLSAEPMNHFAA